MLQAKPLAEVDCDGSVSHVSSASCSSPMSPQQWALGLAALESSSRSGTPPSILRPRHPGTLIPRCLQRLHSKRILSRRRRSRRHQRDSFSVLPKLVSPRSGLRGFRQARVRSGRQERSRFRMQPPGHCWRESVKNVRALGVGACHVQSSGAVFGAGLAIRPDIPLQRAGPQGFSLKASFHGCSRR